METITRKSLLYKSGLGFYCVNHAQGCSHGCRYPCYAFMMARSYGRAASYGDWCKPKLVANAVELLAKELGPRRKKPGMVHFCLTTDPFMYGQPEVAAMTLELVELCNARGVPCSILTKGLLPVELADRGRFPSDNVYGISLVSLDEGFRARWEPGAAPYAARIAALVALHEAGRSTLAHIEPYPTPNILEQDLDALLEAIGFVDSLFFGGWNYSAEAGRFPDRDGFYGEQGKKVRRFCRKLGIGCDIGG